MERFKSEFFKLDIHKIKYISFFIWFRYHVDAVISNILETRYKEAHMNINLSSNKNSRYKMQTQLNEDIESIKVVKQENHPIDYELTLMLSHYHNLYLQE